MAGVVFSSSQNVGILSFIWLSNRPGRDVVIKIMMSVMIMIFDGYDENGYDHRDDVIDEFVVEVTIIGVDVCHVG